MAAINQRRLLLGTVAGGIVWIIWTTVVNMIVLASRYTAAQEAGQLLKEPRYPYFLGLWILTIFAVTYLAARLYANVRTIAGPGPATAAKVGLAVGFIAGFPMNLSIASWVPVDRYLSLWWMLDLWVGALLATLAAGWLYRDSA